MVYRDCYGIVFTHETSFRGISNNECFFYFFLMNTRAINFEFNEQTSFIAQQLCYCTSCDKSKQKEREKLTNSVGMVLQDLKGRL